MKNHRDLLGLVVNTLIVILILFAIVFGLNRIGVYDLPDSVENFFTGLNDNNNSNDADDALIYDVLDFENKNNTTIAVADLNYENAKMLLENVDASVNYSQEVLVENYNGGITRTERFIISKRNNDFDVSVYNENDLLLKTISTKGEYVYITNPVTSGEKQVKLPVSDFSIADECGFVLTHTDFLKTDYMLDASDFEVERGSYGSNLVITFEKSFENYIKTQKYTICLDYGIVTDAECYEEDKLVYKMATVSLHQVN